MLADSQSRLASSKKAMRNPDFAKRFTQVCDEHPGVPELHHGRLGWVRQQLKERFDQTVSVETVRRWLSGEAVPRREKMEHLASLFGVNVAWLSHGDRFANRGNNPKSVAHDQAQGTSPITRSKGQNWLDRLRKELGGTVTIPPGVDITEPTGEVWDAEQ